MGILASLMLWHTHILGIFFSVYKYGHHQEIIQIHQLTFNQEMKPSSLHDTWTQRLNRISGTTLTSLSPISHDSCLPA